MTKTNLTVITEAMRTERLLANVAALADRCSEHRAYAADNCPVCGTARVIGGNA